jgi:hypothetical protein
LDFFKNEIRILGLDIAALLLQNDTDVVNKGKIAELFVGLKLLKYSSCYQKTALHYWHREAKNNQAEFAFRRFKLLYHQSELIEK